MLLSNWFGHACSNRSLPALGSPKIAFPSPPDSPAGATSTAREDSLNGTFCSNNVTDAVSDTRHFFNSTSIESLKDLYGLQTSGGNSQEWPWYHHISIAALEPPKDQQKNADPRIVSSQVGSCQIQEIKFTVRTSEDTVQQPSRLLSLFLRLFQHTELEHTPSNLYQRAKEGIPFIVG